MHNSITHKTEESKSLQKKSVMMENMSRTKGHFIFYLGEYSFIWNKAVDNAHYAHYNIIKFRRLRNGYFPKPSCAK